MKIAFQKWILCALVLTLGVLPAWQAHAQPPQETEFDRAAGIVEKVRSGQTTIEKAFKDGLLTRAVLVAIVGTEQALDPGKGFWLPGEETYRWTSFLLEKYPEVTDENMFLGYGVRLRMALTFFRDRDPRGAQIMEKIIAEIPRKNPDKAVLMAALYNLGNYYLRTGENKKAVETSLKVLEFDIDAPSQANILLGAARGAWAAGDKENANAIYAQVIGIGYGWATGHAHSDMAGHLMAEGKLEEARALMKEPLTGLNGDQFQVILSSGLAQSYFETGEWDEAKKWAQTAVKQYEALGAPIKNHGIEYTYESAKELPRQIEQWQKSPVQLTTQKISITMPKNATQPVRTYFNVSSFRDITTTIVASDATLKTWIFQDPYGYRNRKYQMIGVEISPDITKRETKPEITVSVAEFPDIVFHIPVEIKEKKETP